MVLHLINSLPIDYTSEQQIEWFNGLIEHILSSTEKQAFSDFTSVKESIVETEKIEHYIYLLTSIASMILAQAVKQYFANIKDLPRIAIYSHVLNDFENNLKHHLQKL